MTTKAELMPNFPQAFVGKLSKVLLLTSVGILTTSPGWAVTIGPTSLTVSVPVGSNNSQADGSTQTYSRTTQTGVQPLAITNGVAGTYVDDVLLQTIIFSGTTFNSTNLSATERFNVTVGQNNINAEYGDSDTGSDGNPNPFVSAGIVAEGAAVPDATRESTNPAIQNPALQAAFNSLSISQGIDGEEVTYAYRTIFDQGLVDLNIGVDQIPELIFFERGINSPYTVRAIIGGTFASPTFAPTAVTATAANHTPSGVFINTIEISGRQQLGVVGIDLNEFGITDSTTAIYGIELTSTGASGADIYGNFASASDTANFRTVPSELSGVPEPLTILGSGMALGFGALMKRQYSRKRKET